MINFKKYKYYIIFVFSFILIFIHLEKLKILRKFKKNCKKKERRKIFTRSKICNVIFEIFSNSIIFIFSIFIFSKIINGNK